MEDDEDFESLFFTECSELLVDLQEQLERLAGGNCDLETINAAFRAVHSVKGGAAAFGFSDLISFAHAFETVMDLLRSGSLDFCVDVTDCLLRASDVMAVLIEMAQDKQDVPLDSYVKVLRELEVIAGCSVDAGTDSLIGQTEPADTEIYDGTGGCRRLEYLFSPDEGFIAAGHDPLRMFRAARDFGLSEATPIGEIPPTNELSLPVCPLAWRLVFETDRPEAELRDFFAIYTSSAIFELISDRNEIEMECPVFATRSGVDAAVGQADKSEESEKRTSEKLTASQSTIATPTRASKSLRVDLDRVDRLVNLVGEMLITQSGLAQKIGVRAVENDLDVDHVLETLSRQLRELQENVMTIRAQPIKLVFNRMPRVVRDLSDKLGKKVRLEVSGEATEIDTTVIEELSEPLTHMIRNSMDHGIEDAEQRQATGKPSTGTIRLNAEHRGERVIITVHDDGRGINREAVLKKAIDRGLVSAEDVLTPSEIDGLIFSPGFSTASQISAVSGRGVGMDVVKKKISSLGGRCVLDSDPGKGARFTITLPLTLAVMDGMTVSVGQQDFVLPLSSVVEAVRISESETRHLPSGLRVFSRRGEYIRIVNLASVIGIEPSTNQSDMAIIVDSEDDGHVALRVERLVGQRQVVLKSLEANYGKIEGVSGATILGDGRVALILDVPSIIRLDSIRNPVKELVH
jgi:two-component system, chemotaxis family, sensor kinase CheA